MSKLLKKFIFTFTIISFLGFIAIFLILWNYSNKLPDYKFLKSYKPPVSSKVYSGNGVLISDFSTEKRIFIPYNAIPKKIIHSFFQEKQVICLLNKMTIGFYQEFFNFHKLCCVYYEREQMLYILKEFLICLLPHMYTQILFHLIYL